MGSEMCIRDRTVLAWARPELNGATSAGPSISPPTSSAPAISSQPSFDGSALDSVFKDPQRQVSFLRKFVDSARVALDELARSAAAHDHQHIGFVGHKLKSSAKACGAHALSNTFAELEVQAKVANWGELEQLRGRAEELLGEVRAHVEQRERGLSEKA